MNKSISFCLFVLAVAGWNVNVAARVITVAASGGNYATIADGINAARAGDTVAVQSGTYNEKITTVRAGVAGKKIVIKAVPRRTVDINGVTISHNYVQVEGFRINGSKIDINASYVEVKDNYVSNVPSEGIAVQGAPGNYNNHDIYIGNNLVYHSQYGIMVSGRRITVEKNEVDRLFRYIHGDDDYSRFFGDSIVFRNNWFHGTKFDSTGKHYEVGRAHVDCWQTFDNNGEYAKDITFENNVCSDCDQGTMGEAIYHKNSSRFVYRNNLFLNCGAFGIALVSIGDVSVVNNTFANTRKQIPGYFGVGLSGQNCTNNVIKNNMFYAISENSVSTDSNATAVIDYNFYCRARAHYKKGPHEIENQDPLFFNPDSNDFRLHLGSPAIDAGEDLGVAKDINGRLRKMPPDIGAYEAESVITHTATESSPAR